MSNKNARTNKALPDQRKMRRKEPLAVLPTTVALSDTVLLLYSSVVYIGLVVKASKLIELVAIGRQTLAHFRFA